MPITNQVSGTRIDEIAERIYRIATPLEVMPGGFTFNQYLIVDDAPLLFHTGLRRMFPLVREAVVSVIPPESLRYIAFSHYEADECGSLNDWLAVAPKAEPLCSKLAAMLSVDDVADRPPKTLGDNETLSLGASTIRWFDAPHLPHGSDCGYMMEERTRTLFCGDIFSQPGGNVPPITDGDILGPSEAMRAGFEYYAPIRNSRALFAKLAAARPAILACMHGSAWRGDGAALLQELSAKIG